jgi:hypothetical protein
MAEVVVRTATFVGILNEFDAIDFRLFVPGPLPVERTTALSSWRWLEGGRWVVWDAETLDWVPWR